MIKTKLEQKPDKDWNNRLLSSGIGNHNQTMERGIHFERHGQIPFYLKFIDENDDLYYLVPTGSQYDGAWYEEDFKMNDDWIESQNGFGAMVKTRFSSKVIFTSSGGVSFSEFRTY